MRKSGSLVRTPKKILQIHLRNFSPARIRFSLRYTILLSWYCSKKYLLGQKQNKKRNLKKDFYQN